MTDKQKEAVELLNSIRGKKDIEGTEVMTAEEYLTLLEFIIGEQPQPQITYVPYTPDITPHWPYQPLQPLYQTTPFWQTTAPGDWPPPPFRVTCDGSNQTSTSQVHNDKKED